MTIYTRIVEAVLNLPEDYKAGFSGVVLDQSHTLVWCSDHPLCISPRSKSELSKFVSDYEVIDSHPDTVNVHGRVFTPETHPDITTSTFPDRAEYKGKGEPTVDVRNGEVIWDEF